MVFSKLVEANRQPDYKKTKVLILSTRALETNLLAYFLNREMGLECVHLNNSGVAALRLLSDSQGPGIILRDAKLSNPLDPWSGLGIGAKSDSVTCHLALYRVPRNKGIERKVAERGVRGVFYEDDPPDRFIQGIAVMLEGKLWFSRDIMSDFILKPITPADAPGEPLSKREKEILSMVVSGATNKEIADMLNISPHTVKNHITRIFAKIDVPNRLQAALWASMHL